MNAKSLLTKVAVPVLGLGLLGGTALALAGPASASTGPVPVTCTAANQEALNAQGVINKALDVPEGQTCQLRWVNVHGNVTVEGQLSAASDVIWGNVTVSGPGSSFNTFNQASHITGSLTVTDSTGDSSGMSLGDFTQYPGQNGSLATSQVDGNINLMGDSGWVGLFYSIHANGNLNSSGNNFPNPNWFNISGLTVGGHEYIS